MFNKAHRWLASAEWDRPTLDRLARWTQLSKISSERREDVLTQPMNPRSVTVVVPCYNYGRFLADTLDSALSQPGVDVDVIVVDDASSDDSADVAEAIARVDPRVRLVRQPTNRGQVDTFNLGLSYATGEFVVRLDADDLLTPGSLARGVAAFEANPRVGLVYGYPREFPDPVIPQPMSGTPSWTMWSGQDWIRLRCRRGVNAITTSEAMVRRSIVSEVGGFNPVMRFACDMEWWMRIAARSDVLRINDMDQALHREHSQSLSVTDAAGHLTDLRERRLAFECLFLTAGDRIEDAPVWREVAFRALAGEALRHANYAFDRGRHDPAVVQDFVDFAVATNPAAMDTLPGRAHRLRARLGPDLVSRDPFAVLRVARVRARDELAYLQWTRTGL